MSSATAAWQQVVYGLAWAWRRGDRVLVTVAEYGSNVIALLQLAKCAEAWMGVRRDVPERGRRSCCRLSLQPLRVGHPPVFSLSGLWSCAGARASPSR